MKNKHLKAAFNFAHNLFIIVFVLLLAGQCYDLTQQINEEATRLEVSLYLTIWLIPLSILVALKALVLKKAPD